LACLQSPTLLRYFSKVACLACLQSPTLLAAFLLAYRAGVLQPVAYFLRYSSKIACFTYLQSPTVLAAFQLWRFFWLVFLQPVGLLYLKSPALLTALLT
jgi:hypothetical protein